MQFEKEKKNNAYEECVRDRGGIPKGFSRKPDGVSADKSRNFIFDKATEAQIRKWRCEALAFEALFKTLHESLNDEGDQVVHLRTILNMMSLGVIAYETLLPR